MPNDPNAKPNGSNILSPNPPLVIQIQVDDTGRAQMVMTRDIEFHRIVSIFSQLQIAYAGEIEKASHGQKSTVVAPLMSGLILPKA